MVICNISWDIFEDFSEYKSSSLDIGHKVEFQKIEIDL
jgi:hypothetical protein